MKPSLLYLIMAFAAVLVLPAAISSQADDVRGTIGDHLPGNATGPVGSVGDSYKFDGGFYDKIQEMMNTAPVDGAPNVYDGKIYHDVIFVVPQDDGDTRDPGEVAAENKAALAKRLHDAGALDIRQGEVLSFVTASVPVVELPGLSLHDEVLAIGDGLLPVVSEVGMARMTISATPGEITDSSGIVLNGSGVVVAVLDTGINHPSLNDKVTETVSCTGGPCISSSTEGALDHYRNTNEINISHGTQVAQVLAASNLPKHNGVAPGVELLDVRPATSRGVAHALDWSLKNGADVANMSFSLEENGNKICARTDSETHNRIVNEAVDKGMVVVKSAGNEGGGYGTIGNMGCAHNAITVGGINDRTENALKMYADSSRGPVTNSEPRLKPDLVAPADLLYLLANFTDNNFSKFSGTSFSTSQVSAAVAILLQAKPDLTPVEIKAAVLLGADWTASTPCTSPQFEANNPNDGCSYKKPSSSRHAARDAASLRILNNVGFGILNINQTLEYASERTQSHNHVVGDHLDSSTPGKKYTFSVRDTSTPVKVILTWFVHPHGAIPDQLTRSTAVPEANLGFTISTPTGRTISADSKYQTSEFAVFRPTATGTYTITVTGSGLDKINKPVQNYAIASTHSLTALPALPANAAPVAHARTVIIDPHLLEPAIVRLTGADQNGDSISFSISRDPEHGTASADEQITKTVSRMFYTKDSSFVTSDSFEVTPQDGFGTGLPATITVRAESLPTGSERVDADSSKVKKWSTLEVTRGYLHTEYSQTSSGPGYPVSAIYLGSVNMEGADARIVTTKGTYTAAVPPSGDRMIQFASPLTVKTLTLSADGIDEEASHDNRKSTSSSPGTRNAFSPFVYDDVRVFAGYVPSACTPGSVSGAQGSNSCPTYATYDASSSPALGIADNTRAQGATDAILVPVNGTVRSASVSVNVTHAYIGDLRVNLSSPDGKTITLHNRAGGATDDITKTYGPAILGSLSGSHVAGNWTLSIGDYARGDVGVLNSWSLSVQYEPAPVTSNRNGTSSGTATVFSEDFEGGTLARWTESGKGNWQVTTSQSHSVPTIPGHPRANKVLHADDCDIPCTLTTKSTIDLSGYKYATLSFWRFVDSALDGSEYLKVEVSDGSSWTTIFHWSDNNNGDDSKWHRESYDLSQQYAGKPSVSLRFVTQQSVSSEDVQVDDIVINATNTKTAGPASPPANAEYSVYVADTDDNEILAYSSAGSYLDDIIPSKSGGLAKPYDVVFGPDGHMYVSDNTYKKIRKYNGATGASLGQTATNAEWASTEGIPHGMAWRDNALYVATLRGVEKISATGSNQGYFGDASRTPFGAGIPRLVSPYDVAFCPDGRMYVADRSLGKVLYYDAATGKYKGTISSTPSSTQPNMRSAAGLECGPAIAGTAGTTSIYQGGDDPGRVNEINYSTKKLVRQFVTLVDEPYGMDSDAAGSLYIANKDDDNILKIHANGTTSVFVTGSLDDPRGVAIGPKHTAQVSSDGDVANMERHDNDGPEILLLNGTHRVHDHEDIRMRQNTTATFGVTATDPEGDPITLDLIPYAIPTDAISMTAGKNGTATVSLGTSSMNAGTYAFMITASDSQNLERYAYTVVVYEP